MNLRQALARPPWRTVVPACALVIALGLGYWLWSPGRDITDGRHDLGRNGIWLQHGWMADDNWFLRERKTNQMAQFRDPLQIEKLTARLRANHITDVFLHLCPAEFDGRLPSVDHEQAEQFLREVKGFRVMPWVGGVLNLHVRLSRPEWRSAFAANVRQLMEAHPAFAGVHLNVEPLPSGDRDFLALLETVRAALPPGKLISVAAYPPPTRWQRSADVHWDEAYFRQVAARVDQMVVMMYDTSLKNRKVYESLMASWTREALSWSGGKSVLLGLPAYKDSGVDYHDPGTENLVNALRGVHGGLISYRQVPACFQGIAIYSEWAMTDSDWGIIRGHFLRSEH